VSLAFLPLLLATVLTLSLLRRLYNRILRLADEIKQNGGKVLYAGSDGLARGTTAAPLSKK